MSSPTLSFDVAFAHAPNASSTTYQLVYEFGSANSAWRISVDTDGTLVTTDLGDGATEELYLTDADGVIWHVTVSNLGFLSASQVGAAGDGKRAGATVVEYASLTDANGVEWRVTVADFGFGPGDVGATPLWVDLTSRLGDPGGIDWRVGRQTEVDRMEAGNGSLTLDNDDRALDPTNEDSPYYPYVRPMVPVRLKATFDAVTYDVFHGFVESWKPTWRDPEVGWTTLSIVDGTALLAMAKTSASYTSDPSGTRIGDLLDAADWPAGKRDLDAGQSDVQAYTASDRIVLNAIREAETAEDGVFFIAPDGDATFRDRTARIVSASQATFGDDGSEFPFSDLSLSYDDTRLFNEVSVKPEGLAVQNASDEVSIARYGRRWLEKDASLITTTAEASDAAHWLLRRYKDPRLRVESVQLDGHHNDDVLEQILTRGIGDRITVKRRPPGGGDPISVDVFIEHIHHRLIHRTWTATWQLSPAFSETVWLLGVTGFSEVGQTTALGYAYVLPLPAPLAETLLGAFDMVMGWIRWCAGFLTTKRG